MTQPRQYPAELAELNYDTLFEERAGLLVRQDAPEFSRSDKVRLAWLNWQVLRFEYAAMEE